jgi:hypothetical protein
MLRPASTRMRVLPVDTSAAFPELPLASTQNLTVGLSSPTLQNTSEHVQTKWLFYVLGVRITP